MGVEATASSHSCKGHCTPACVVVIRDSSQGERPVEDKPAVSCACLWLPENIPKTWGAVVGSFLEVQLFNLYFEIV